MATIFTQGEHSSELKYDIEDLKLAYEDRWSLLHPIRVLAEWAHRAGLSHDSEAVFMIWGVVENMERVIDGMRSRGEPHEFERMLEILSMPFGDERERLLGPNVTNFT